MTLRFTVYGAAAAKGSMRAFMNAGMHHPVVIDSNRTNVRSWQQTIREAASRAIAQLPVEDRRLIVGGVRCEVMYFLPRPKALNAPKYRGVEVAHTKTPDIDKLTRAVLDALTAVAWTDDAQVVELVSVKRYAAVSEPPRVDVAVMPTTLSVFLPLLSPQSVEA